MVFNKNNKLGCYSFIQRLKNFVNEYLRINLVLKFYEKIGDDPALLGDLIFKGILGKRATKTISEVRGE